MTTDDASALETFVRDHDTRFVPKAAGDSVLLKEPETGKEITVSEVEEYRAKFIEGVDPGPTIRTAWEKWMAGRG